MRLTFWSSLAAAAITDYREVLLLRTNFSVLRTLSKQTTAGANQ
ncbi:MAG: hypothetical protein R2911_00015 [Caldilineaceae bacterium]